MKLKPGAQQVLDQLGLEKQAVIIDAVDQAREDLRVYRTTFPRWHVRFSQRYISNFLHERIWAVLVERFDGDDSTDVIDREPSRLIRSDGIEMRVKRHSEQNIVSSYPTQTAIKWFGNQEELPELAAFNISIGYQWIKDEEKVGPAVIACPKGLGKAVEWAVILERNAETAAIEPRGIEDPEIAKLDLSALIAGEESEGA